MSKSRPSQLIAAAALYWATPEAKEKQRKFAKQMYVDRPELGENTSIRMKQFWSDPVLKSQRVAAMKNGVKCTSKPIGYTHKSRSIEFRSRQSEISKKRFEDYSLREKLCEISIGGFWYGNVRYNDAPQYCTKFDNNFKERVRTYWGHICFNCGTPQNGEKLHVHHLHYDKQMCCNGSPRDVLPLCKSCHLKTNHNRDYWEIYLTGLLYAWCPDGKCYFTKEEMKQFQESKQ